MVRFISLLSMLLFVGCSTFPEKLHVENTETLESYENASSNAEQLIGKPIRWGGAIARIDNKQDSTTFEIVHYPLNGFGRPLSDDESIGRFRIKVNGFMVS